MSRAAHVLSVAQFDSLDDRFLAFLPVHIRPSVREPSIRFHNQRFVHDRFAPSSPPTLKAFKQAIASSYVNALHLYTICHHRFFILSHWSFHITAHLLLQDT
jgi:hypothetical protein